jgi:hypothetical protein
MRDTMQEPEILETIRRLMHDEYATENEESLVMAALEKVEPGVVQVIFRTGQTLRTPEEVLAKARHDRRVIAVGPDGAAGITHPDRKP